MSEIKEMEMRLRSLMQPKVVASLNSLPTKNEGEENEMKTVYYKGNYYLGIKINNSWRYFQETKLTEA